MEISLDESYMAPLYSCYPTTLLQTDPKECSPNPGLPKRILLGGEGQWVYSKHGHSQLLLTTPRALVSKAPKENHL